MQIDLQQRGQVGEIESKKAKKVSLACVPERQLVIIVFFMSGDPSHSTWHCSIKEGDIFFQL